MIPVTKPYFPNRDKLNRYIDGIYECGWLTNNGPLVQELTRRLREYLDIDNLLLVANGTLALQIAYRALGVCGQSAGGQTEAITTPFSFIATASSLKWEGVEPVFTDIDPGTWCLDPSKIEAAITPRTRAIVPVHVFGNACEVEDIEAIAHRNKLKVIYDGAHAFGATFKGESLLKNGDATTLSFHATKLFHTLEGGAVIFNRKEDLERARKMINFGITGPETIEELGINAKMNEFQAAMGLCVLDEIEENLSSRGDVWLAYETGLKFRFQLQQRHPKVTNNYAYFPLLMESEQQVETTMERLKAEGVFARRYFYPSLETVFEQSGEKEFSVSRDVASRIICLPLYAGMSLRDCRMIESLLQG